MTTVKIHMLNLLPGTYLQVLRFAKPVTDGLANVGRHTQKTKKKKHATAEEADKKL
jgi:hypothetical protein